MPDRDMTFWSWAIGIIVSLFTFLIAALKYIWSGHLKEVDKIMTAQSLRVDKNAEDIASLKRSLPIEMLGLKAFAVDSFTSKTEFRSKIKHIEDVTLGNHQELKADNKEIKDILTKMRSDTIERQAKELADKDRRIQELLDGERRK